jgi:hypothetical protein
MARESKTTANRTRGPCTFTQGDLDRQVRAARKNGFKVKEIKLQMTLVVEDDDGKTIVLADKADKASGSESLTPLEEWRKKKGRGQS